MSIIPDFNQAKIDAIAADMSPVYCKLSETTLQLCLHLLTRQPESESFWTLAGDTFDDVLSNYVHLAQKELIDAMNPVAKDIIFVPYKDVTETTVQDAIEQLEDIKEDAGAAAAVASDLADHEGLTNNPHSVTAAQAGAVSKTGDTVSGFLAVLSSGYAVTVKNATINSYLGLQIKQNDSDSNKVAFLKLGADHSNPNALYLANIVNGVYCSMSFDNNGDIIFAPVGEVAIGTTTPNEKLTVNGGIAIKDGMTAPAATSGYAKIYVDSADGNLKVRFGNGVIKTLATN